MKRRSDKIPVIFIHTGEAPYLRYTLSQAKISNPDATIYLIGDESNDRFDFIEHRLIEDYAEGAELFSKIYKHLSSNSYHFELFCFQRWFILKEFMFEHKIEKCVYLDSDVMLYADLVQEQAKFSSFDFAISYGESPHCTFINGIDSLSELCEFIRLCYTDSNLFKRVIENKFQTLLFQGLPGGACDMTVYKEYGKRNPDKLGDISAIIGASKFDHNINLSEGFEMANDIKKIIWIDNQPFGRHITSDSLIKFNALHFSGSAKKYIKDHFKGAMQSSENEK